ncbi:hypothetical protein LINPERHAP1_LOCUS3602 [Linum perenne]
MKREGRQHGMVRTYPVLPSPINSRLDESPPPVAGIFAKVSRKPTNHSKFTGKCGVSRCKECHIHPCTKSRDKAKGTQKSRSNDVVSNHRLVTWRVADGGHVSKCDGFSATGMLDRLEVVDRDFDDDFDGDEGCGEVDYGVGDEIEEHMSFCDVGFVVEQVEDWCLVEELK